MNIDSKETFISMTLLTAGISMEIHHYNVTNGEKKFIYELQAKIDQIYDSNLWGESTVALLWNTTGESTILSVSRGSRTMGRFRKSRLLLTGITTCLDTPVVSGIDDDNVMHIGALNMTALNFTTHFYIQGEAFKDWPVMLTPVEGQDKFYILSSGFGDDFPVIVKATFKEEDGFKVSA